MTQLFVTSRLDLETKCHLDFGGLIGTIKLNGAFNMAINNIGYWTYSCAIPTTCVHESAGFRVGNTSFGEN
jgi:hypothetical protein